MSKNFHKMKSREKEHILANLHQTAKTVTGNNAVLRFITEALTEGEKITIGRRIAVAQMILQGYTYYDINNKLQVSPNTVVKVRKWLNEHMPGYESVLKEEKQKRADHKQKTKHTGPFSLERLKQKYPLHFLLLHIYDELGR